MICYIEIIGPYDNTFLGPLNDSIVEERLEELHDLLDANVFDTSVLTRCEFDKRVAKFGAIAVQPFHKWLEEWRNA